MTELEDLIDKTTVDLKHLDIKNLKDTDKFIRYLAWELPAQISYKESCNKIVTGPVLEIGSMQVNGAISKDVSKNDIPYALFSMNYDFNEEKFSTLVFNTIPGYDFEEHSPGQRKLWSDVKEIVKNSSADNIAKKYKK